MAYENLTYADEKEFTHIQVSVRDKERLEELKKKHGYGSVRVVVNKLLNKCGKTVK